MLAKKECTADTYAAMYYAINFAFHHMCIYIYIYVYLYIYEDVITTEVQIYIRGISLVRTFPNSSTKQL